MLKLKTKLGFWNILQISNHSYLVNPVNEIGLFSLSQNGVIAIISIIAQQFLNI